VHNAQFLNQMISICWDVQLTTENLGIHSRGSRVMGVLPHKCSSSEFSVPPVEKIYVDAKRFGGAKLVWICSITMPRLVGKVVCMLLGIKTLVFCWRLCFFRPACLE